MTDGYQSALALLNTGLDHLAVGNLTGLPVEIVRSLIDALRGEGGGTLVNDNNIETLNLLNHGYYEVTQ